MTEEVSRLGFLLNRWRCFFGDQLPFPDIALDGLRLHVDPADELHLGDHPLCLGGASKKRKI